MMKLLERIHEDLEHKFGIARMPNNHQFEILTPRALRAIRKAIALASAAPALTEFPCRLRPGRITKSKSLPPADARESPDGFLGSIPSPSAEKPPRFPASGERRQAKADAHASRNSRKIPVSTADSAQPYSRSPPSPRVRSATARHARNPRHESTETTTAHRPWLRPAQIAPAGA